MTNLDAQGIAEAQMPVVLQAVAENAAGDERRRPLVAQNISISFTNGVATLPTYVLTKYMQNTLLFNASSLTTVYSWVRNYAEFVDPSIRFGPFSGYGYYTLVAGDTLAVTEPGALYNPASGLTGSRTLNAPTVPVIPATYLDQLIADDEIVSDIIELGAEMLRGATAQAVGTAQR